MERRRDLKELAPAVLVVQSVSSAGRAHRRTLQVKSTGCLAVCCRIAPCWGQGRGGASRDRMRPTHIAEGICFSQGLPITPSQRRLASHPPAHLSAVAHQADTLKTNRDRDGHSGVCAFNDLSRHAMRPSQVWGPLSACP